MGRAILSRVNFNEYDEFLAIEFTQCIEDLLECSDVKRLQLFSQHFNTSRLQHSINVAYYSYLVCKVFNFDYKSAARAGLLHDLFLYDWRVEKQPEGHHAYAHPRVALRTAQKIADLNKIEQDAIVKHMWPVTLRLPRYKESLVVSFVDKYCCCLEVIGSAFGAVRSSMQSILEK